MYTIKVEESARPVVSEEVEYLEGVLNNFVSPLNQEKVHRALNAKLQNLDAYEQVKEVKSMKKTVEELTERRFKTGVSVDRSIEGCGLM